MSLAIASVASSAHIDATPTVLSQAEGRRASLENAHTSERVGFAGLDALFAFLRGQTDGEVSAVEREGQAGDEAPTEPDAQSR